MEQPARQCGPVERAVRSHHPTESVLFEAGALDRELAAAGRAGAALSPDASWEALIRSMQSFSSHYPAILLRAPEALDALGRACLEGMRQAPGVVLRERAASLLVDMLGRVVDEVQREGPDRVPGEVPATMDRLLGSLASDRRHAREHPRLEPLLLAFGKRVLLVGGEGVASEVWFALLGTATRLLLDVTLFRVEGEPFYDGRWDGTRLAQHLEVGMLGPVRRERLDADRQWLQDMRARLDTDAQSGTDVFLELSAYANRDHREQAWGAWFDAVAARALEGGLRPGVLEELGRALAGWIEQARDRRFLARLAAMLRRVAADVAAANGRAGLITALDTFGCAVTGRLREDAGRGEVDAALADLRATVVALLERLFALGERGDAGSSLVCGLQARTGPVLGRPFDRQDVVWRLRMLAAHPEPMDALLYDLLAGLCIEEVVLRDDVAEGPAADTGEGRIDTLGAALADMLRRSWDGGRLHAVRALVRVTPLSPFHLGGASTRAHLLALASPVRTVSYLHDLTELVLSRSGPGNLQAVEQVLRFWQSGDTRHLDSLARPGSLAALPGHVREDDLDHVRELMARLARHAPGAREGDIRWMARLPEAFYHEGTLVKVAGFAGCSSQALYLLVNMLHVYRDLFERYEGGGSRPPEPDRTPRQLLDHLERLTAQRRQMVAGLFAPGALDDLDPIGCLDAFGRELAVAAEVVRVCESLADAGTDGDDLAPALARVLVEQAALSGLPLGSLDDPDPLDAPAAARLLEASAAVRVRLADRLLPHVQDSVQRLRQNPLARPAAPYRRLFEGRADRPPEELAREAAGLLADELLAADGGLPVLERVLKRFTAGS